MNAPPYSGMQVGSSVVLKHLLSRGGMGSIWVGEHRGLQIDVAVKFLSPELARDADAGERFKREAAAAARVKSPHVVSVFDQGLTDDGLPYIVMELLEGEDLGKRIERLGPRPLSEVVAIVNQLARALGTAHAQGIVHRDIKPDNVFLIDADGELFVKLLDFGIAKRVKEDAPSVTSTGVMMGTPYFMSPEQVLSAKDVDARADIWSLGAVVYVALTGRVPFQGETLGAVCCAIVTGELEPVTRSRRDLPPAIDDWFERALHRDLALRFESVREMAAALELAAGVSPSRVEAPRVPRFERSQRAAPLVQERERSDLPASSPHPTKFEATVGVPTPTRRKRHIVTTAVSVLSALAFASVIGATLFLSPQEFEQLKETLSRTFGRAPSTAIQASSPELTVKRQEPPSALPERVEVAPSPAPSSPLGTGGRTASPTVSPRGEAAPVREATQPRVPPAAATTWRAPRLEDTPRVSAPEAVVEPTPVPSEDPIPPPGPASDSPYGSEETDEQEPGPYDEPDYGF